MENAGGNLLLLYVSPSLRMQSRIMRRILCLKSYLASPSVKSQDAILVILDTFSFGDDVILEGFESFLSWWDINLAKFSVRRGM